MTDAVEECGNCKFWARRTDGTREIGGGYCLRYPPFFPSELHVHRPMEVALLADIGLSSKFLNDAWPNTGLQSWCGEYQPGRSRWNPEDISAENDE